MSIAAATMGFAMRQSRPEAYGGPPVSIGIDLGTSYSRVGVWKDGDVVIIPNDRGKLATPSCVAFTEDGVFMGEAAMAQAEENLDNTIFAPQRLLGYKLDNPMVQWYTRMWPCKVTRGELDNPLIVVKDRGKERFMRPEEVVALLIEHLRKIAERFLGAPANEAVITIPAQYGPNQCSALEEACKIARLKVLGLVKSPTAAGIAFCLTNPCKERRHVLVCDMGASYFDFALLTVDEKTLVERAIGTDFVDLDSCLLRYCKQDLKDRCGVSIDWPTHKLAELKLRQACELTKRKLSQWAQSRIEVPDIIEGVDYQLTISRGHFEDTCRRDIDPLLDPIVWCLEDLGLDRADVDVVLVGGSARIPRVRRAVKDFFYGAPPREVLRPDHAAVLGAAVYVASKRSPDNPGGGPPSEIKDLRVIQVESWSALTEDLDALLPSERSNGCVPGGAGSSDPSNDDDLGFVPVDEASGRIFPIAAARSPTAARPASGFKTQSI